jgi:hypothetical protein
MNLHKYILLKKFKNKLQYILYHNNNLIDTIYDNIIKYDTESIYKNLLKEINEIKYENIKIKEILYDIKYYNLNYYE